MADGINARTQRLTREQIAVIVGNNPRAIKQFESMVGDVVETLPDAIDAAVTRVALSRPAINPTRVRAFDGVTVSLEPGGYAIGLDMGYVIGSVAAFIQRKQAPQAPAFTDAQNILAGRVFARR